ncbi:SRPBCC family protein [candidate division KSB1 bacterium]
MIHSYIEINASMEKIWEILLDFKSYADWNPFIKSVSGEAAVGSRLSVTMEAPGMKPQVFKPVVTEVWDKKQFRWLGKLGIPGLFDGEHMFILEDIDRGKIRFHQNEVFRGLLVPMTKDIQQKALLGFKEMNKALKARAEAQ